MSIFFKAEITTMATGGLLKDIEVGTYIVSIPESKLEMSCSSLGGPRNTLIKAALTQDTPQLIQDGDEIDGITISQIRIPRR